MYKIRLMLVGISLYQSSESSGRMINKRIRRVMEHLCSKHFLSGCEPLESLLHDVDMWESYSDLPANKKSE